MTRLELYTRLQSMRHSRGTIKDINRTLSLLCETEMHCYFADEQNALDFTLYFAKTMGDYDLDGTIYVLPQRKGNTDGEPIYYITEISLD